MVAFKIWLKHETFLIYRVLCAESNKLETHFQLWSESCVNRSYLSTSDGIFSQKTFSIIVVYLLIKCQQLVKYELCAWNTHQWYNIMNCCDLEYVCVLKMWFYKEFMSKYAAVSHMTKILIEHCSFTSRFRIAIFSTQSHQGTFKVD